jgi:hypothetical protein
LRRLYLDTSFAVGFLQAHAQQPLLISAWVSTGLASALALLERRGAITPQETQEAWQRFVVFRANRLQDLPLAPEDFEAAAHHQVVHEQLLI